MNRTCYKQVYYRRRVDSDPVIIHQIHDLLQVAISYFDGISELPNMVACSVNSKKNLVCLYVDSEAVASQKMCVLLSLLKSCCLSQDTAKIPWDMLESLPSKTGWYKSLHCTVLGALQQLKNNLVLGEYILQENLGDLNNVELVWCVYYYQASAGCQRDATPAKNGNQVKTRQSRRLCKSQTVFQRVIPYTFHHFT